ncbi:MAG: chemotaxis protein CheC [Deltaproteobacteria bacterium]|jgi:chemotaxis protein CheC|nr:chemotaxis protein CheC [Deltaproteobacteria bacterium]
MTNVSEKQEDALKEVINIAFSRAAASLSELTGTRVLLDAPRINIQPIKDLQSALGGLMKGEVATVHQVFGGEVAGDACLILNQEGAVELTNLLTGRAEKKERLYELDREALNEVGNILLTACLGTFGIVLDVNVTFAVPRMRMEAISNFIDSLHIDDQRIQTCLIVS